jgi:Proteolysis_6 C-terminal
LRACTSAIRERQGNVGLAKKSEDDEVLEALICRSDLMVSEDGYRIVRAMKGPYPLDMVDESSEWWRLVNKWLVAAPVLEMQHASEIFSGSVERASKPLVSDSTTANATSANSSSLQWRLSLLRAQIRDSSSADEMDERLNEVNDHQPGFLQMGGVAALQGSGVDDDDGEDTDDEMMQDVEMIDLAQSAEEFAGQVIGGPDFNQATTIGSGDADESLDGYSSSDGEGGDSNREFAHVSTAPVIYDQPSLLGVRPIGTGRRGAFLDISAACSVMCDLSHLGLVHLRSKPIFCLVGLPKSFVELYNIVNKVKGRDEASGVEDVDDAGNSETAICLLTGAVMRSGSARRPFSRAARQPGACTKHARKTGSGIGMFFLVQKCTVLLMHNNKSAYSPSLYVDSHGEEDPGLKRGRPLFLNEARYRALELLWRQQCIPREVAQIRSTSDRVIRDNWY